MTDYMVQCLRCGHLIPIDRATPCQTRREREAETIIRRLLVDASTVGGLQEENEKEAEAWLRGEPVFRAAKYRSSTEPFSPDDQGLPWVEIKEEPR